jgi:drug/metabolite transporter (DMT)-like permease
MIAGMVFFDEVVTGQFILGSSIVIAASIFIIYRERVTGGANRHSPDRTSRK